MKLIYHPLSPYSRKVYMLACELNLDNQIILERVVVAPVHYPGWSDNNADVARLNPLAKIPTLVLDDGTVLFDSRVICEFLEFLDAQSPKAHRGSNEGEESKMRWRRKTIHACADGILDAQVLLFYENKIRKEQGLRFQAWVDGQTEKFLRGLDFLEREVSICLSRRGNNEPADVADVAIAACLASTDGMRFEWREGRPKLTGWFEEWMKRESFVKTKGDIDWKTGEKNEIGFKPF